MNPNAGSHWCALYPTSRELEDLVEPFQSGVRAFIADLKSRGVGVRISATRRPYERAWLMHHAWKILKGEMLPELVPVHPEIPILWSYDGAKEMVATYELKVKPSLTSRHIQGRAIDMTLIGWEGSKKALWELGASHGVIKLPNDPPHWSDDGH